MQKVHFWLACVADKKPFLRTVPLWTNVDFRHFTFRQPKLPRFEFPTTFRGSEWIGISWSFQTNRTTCEVNPNFRKFLPGSFLSIQPCSQNLLTESWGESILREVDGNLVPRAFPLKNGWGGKRPWHRLVTCPLVHLKILGVIKWV